MALMKRITAEEWKGRVVGRYRVLEVLKEGHHSINNTVKVECVECGKTSVKKMSSLKTYRNDCPGYDRCGELKKRKPGDRVGNWTLVTDLQRNIWMAKCGLCQHESRVRFSAGTLAPCDCTRLNSKFGRRRVGDKRNGWELKEYTEKGFLIQKCLGCGVEKTRAVNAFALAKCKCHGRDTAKDITGRQYGLLTAIRRVGQDKHRNAVWLFQCLCGNQVEEPLIKFSYPMKKGVYSCGCARRWKMLVNYLQKERTRYED